MGTQKAILSLCLAVVMVFTTLPVIGSSAAEEDPQGEAQFFSEGDAFDFKTETGRKKLMKKERSYPAEFDLRDEGCVTSVKFQNPFGSDAELPEDAQIRWALADGGEEFVDLIVDTANGSSSAKLTTKNEGETYLIVTVDGVGTTVLPLRISRSRAAYFEFVEDNPDGTPLGWTYTGEPIEPDIIIYLSAPLYWQAKKDIDYTLTYSDNILCFFGRMFRVHK